MHRLNFGVVFVALLSFCSHVRAQQPESGLSFEVSSVKLSSLNTLNGGIKPLSGGYGYTSQNLPVKLIISLMYRVPMRQIKNAPDWLGAERYDIDAKADRAYSVEELHVMFQNLLADRFRLKFHWESKEGNVYALTVDPAGLKMKANLSEQDFNIPVIPSGAGQFSGKRVPMPYLSWFLGQQLQSDARPVVDKTGLTGSYDFNLAFSPQQPPGAGKEDLPPELQDRPSLFEALRQQLGLRLLPEKGMVPYFVIDHVEKPADN